MSYSVEEKTNLKELEGPEESFVDLLQDIGLYDIKEKEKVSYGEYENTFTCISVEKSLIEGEDDEPGVVKETRVVKANFYENQEDITLVIVTLLDEDDGEVVDYECYWFDTSDNDIPSMNENWAEILENMDIFLDDDED